MHSWKQFAVAIVLVGAAIAAAFAVASHVTPTSFSGVVQSTHHVDLNFPATGRLLELDVRPGDRVKAGQVIARQDQSVAGATLNSAKAILAADQARLVELQAPPLSDAERAGLALQQQQAQSSLSAARLRAVNAAGVAGSAVAQAQTAVNNAQGVLTVDEGRYASLSCTSATQSATCQNLAGQVARQQAALSNAVAALVHVQALARRMRDDAQKTVNNSLIAVSTSNNAIAMKTSPATPAEIALAKAQVVKDQADVALDQRLVDQLDLVAPVDGLVTEASGTVGDLVGDFGVHNFGGPAAQSPDVPSFSLFPPPPQAATVTATQSYRPLISMATTAEWQVIAEVPESAVSHLRASDAATVKLNALNESLPAKIDRIIPVTVQKAGTVTYDVLLTVTGTRNGILPGMSVSVVMGG